MAPVTHIFYWFGLGRSQAKGLNKIALADVYIKAGMPHKAIRALENEQESYRSDKQKENELLVKLKAEFPEWELLEQQDSRRSPRYNITALTGWLGMGAGLVSALMQYFHPSMPGIFITVFALVCSSIVVLLTGPVRR